MLKSFLLAFGDLKNHVTNTHQKVTPSYGDTMHLKLGRVATYPEYISKSYKQILCQSL